MLLLLKEVSLAIQGVRKSFSTHLCFAGDLVIFAAGNVNAFNFVVTVFYQFYSLYGLIFNPSKCEVFFGAGTVAQVDSVAGFKIRRLPVKYHRKTCFAW